MSDEERSEVIDFIAANLKRASHWAAGCAKSGFRARAAGRAAAIGSFMCSAAPSMPIFLVTIFAKNEKANLSKAEQAAAVQLSRALLATYGDRR